MSDVHPVRVVQFEAIRMGKSSQRRLHTRPGRYESHCRRLIVAYKMTAVYADGTQWTPCFAKLPDARLHERCFNLLNE